MRRILLFTLLAFSFGAGRSQTILFNQTNTPSSAGGASQDFETSLNNYDCMQADDFIIPNDEAWKIDSVLAIGTYSATSVATAGTVARFMNNNSNNKPGGLIWDTTITANMDPQGDGSIVGIFDNPLTLGPGTYWLGMSARKDFSSGGGQWYWSHNASGVGSNIHWRNQGGGFASGCASWSAASNCLNTTLPAAQFIMYGCKIVGVGSIGNDTVICQGDTANFDVTSTGATSYAWSNGATTPSISVDSQGTYEVTITFSGGCIDEVVQSVDLEVGGQLVVNMEDDTICEDGPPAIYLAPNCGNCSYMWSDSSTGPIFSTDEEGWVFITVSLGSGCDVVDSAYVTLEIPEVQIVPSDTAEFCEGDSIQLGTVDTYMSYKWYIDSGSSWSQLGVDPGQTIYTGGSYKVDIITASGCPGSDSILAIEHPTPFPNISQGWTQDWRVKLVVSLGYTTYEWSNGSTGSNLIVGSNKTYAVTVVDQFGCIGSDSIVVTVAGEDELLNNDVAAFPNPTHGDLHITLPSEMRSGLVTFILMDDQGRQVQSGNLNGANPEIDISGQPAGKYSLEIIGEEQSRVRKVIKD